ncbi:hypothetical protein NDU88_007775 [Pleurodeles waltl]|uniref:Uncharacterized protein n=1 Tax=Pleurodeles waltl TaxID=8319 RepID=A0AAV7PMV3_PLEWA|nr:hypothetical protein NDU88_007775 [Pleurodeles waltl]
MGPAPWSPPGSPISQGTGRPRGKEAKGLDHAQLKRQRRGSLLRSPGHAHRPPPVPHERSGPTGPQDPSRACLLVVPRVRGSTPWRLHDDGVGLPPQAARTQTTGAPLLHVSRC